MPRWSSSDVVTDRRLVHGLNDGDEAALATLYDTYAERLYDYALSMTGEYKNAADITHDTFIDAGRRAPRMRDHQRLRSWLYGAVRRRCVQRSRSRVLYWESDVEFGDHPPFAGHTPESLQAGKGGTRDGSWKSGPGSAVLHTLQPSAELRRLLEDSMARLEPGEQEALLLTVRHGLSPAEVAAVLGFSSRRATGRVKRSRARLDAVYETELALAAERCAAGSRSQPATDPADAKAELEERGASLPATPGSQDGHDNCADCERRARLPAAALLAVASVPLVPKTLRHRVLHTATDPELAGYRADIAARGGALTPNGMPTQPDTASPVTKRWLFVGGGMAGALVTALLGALIIGPGLGDSTIYWPPFGARPQPSITDQPQGQPHGRGDGQKDPGDGDSPGGSGSRPPLGQQGQSPSPPGSSTPSSPIPPKPGTLTVTPTRVELYKSKTGTVRLAASQGPVSWNATSSSKQVTVSHPQGRLAEDDTADVTVTLSTMLINLPGEATITFADPATGAAHQVTVVWGISIL